MQTALQGNDERTASRESMGMRRLLDAHRVFITALLNVPYSIRAASLFYPRKRKKKQKNTTDLQMFSPLFAASNATCGFLLKVMPCWSVPIFGKRQKQHGCEVVPKMQLCPL